MKNLIFISIIFLASCKKETTPQPIAPSQPITGGVNYVIINGDFHYDDTVRFENNLIAFPDVVGSDTLRIQGLDTSISQRGVTLFCYPVQHNRITFRLLFWILPLCTTSLNWMLHLLMLVMLED